jgi:hypothetical protein
MTTIGDTAGRDQPADTVPAGRVLAVPAHRRLSRSTSTKAADGPLTSDEPSAIRMTPWRGVAVVGAVMVVVGYAVAAALGRPTAPAVVMVPGLLALMYPLIRITDARFGKGFDLLGIIYVGLVARFAATYYRFDNASDAFVYHNVGRSLAREFRQLNFGVDTGRDIPGTGSVRYLSGLVSIFTGTSMFAEFLVFTCIAFLGLLMFYVAFATALPNGDRRRYAYLVFLWPSLVVWPSSIGKESTILFGLGLAALGTARLYTHRRGGFVLLLLGLTAVLLVRPHVALLLFIGVGTGYLFVRSTRGSVVLSGTKMIAIAVLVIGGSVLVSQTADFLNLENLGTEEVEAAQARTQEQTRQGGGSFDPITADNPVRYPVALVSVLIRPLPFEARTAEAYATSAEGLLLVALVAVSWKRIVRLPRLLFSEPYVAFALTCVLVFGFAFSAIGNFGILARQRAQVLPFLFVLLALPARSVTPDPDEEPQRGLQVNSSNS